MKCKFQHYLVGAYEDCNRYGEIRGVEGFEKEPRAVMVM